MLSRSGWWLAAGPDTHSTAHLSLTIQIWALQWVKKGKHYVCWPRQIMSVAPRCRVSCLFPLFPSSNGQGRKAARVLDSWPSEVKGAILGLMVRYVPCCSAWQLCCSFRNPTALAAQPSERGVAAVAGSWLDYATSELCDSPAAGAGPSPRGILGIELLRIRRRLETELTASVSHTRGRGGR